MLFPSPSQIFIVECPSSIAKSMEDVKVFSKSLVDSELWESHPDCVPMPCSTSSFDDVKEKGKLTLGDMKFDGGVMPHPPVTRAMNLAVERLQKAGHEVIELELPFDTYELMENAAKMYFL